jgi:membrane fusion protein (multidrug efflux system)
MADTSSSATAGRSRLKLFLTIALVVAGAAAGLAWWMSSDRQTTDDAQIDGHIVPLAARVQGTVQTVHVKDNQLVKAGDVLVELDPRDFQLAAARAEAELADARAAADEAASGVPVAQAASTGHLSGARAGVQEATAAIDAARAAVNAAVARRAAAEARLKVAESANRKAAADLARFEPLIKKEEISRAQYDAAVSAADSAQASVASAHAAVAEAENDAARAQSQVAQAQAGLTGAEASASAAAAAPSQIAASRAHASGADARVQRAQAALEQAKLNLEYTRVKAARGGLVSRRTVEPGQIVQAGQPLLAIVPLDDVWVTANFKETQLEQMRPGQEVRVAVDAYDHAFAGRLDSIAAATGARFSLLPPENASGNFVKVVQRVPVKIVLDPGQDPEQRLRPGMSVHVTVNTR